MVLLVFGDEVLCFIRVSRWALVWSCLCLALPHWGCLRCLMYFLAFFIGFIAMSLSSGVIIVKYDQLGFVCSVICTYWVLTPLRTFCCLGCSITWHALLGEVGWYSVYYTPGNPAGLPGIPTQLWHLPQVVPRVVQTTGSMHPQPTLPNC